MTLVEVLISVGIAGATILLFIFVIKPLLIPSKTQYSAELQARIDATPVVAPDIAPGMTEEKFWELIELCWAPLDLDAIRKDWALGRASERTEEKVEVGAILMCRNLEAALGKLDNDDLATFDSILERKLYELDSQQLAERVDGGDDSFLYIRGFIVAMGQQFYDYVRREPKARLLPVHCEEITYLPAEVYARRNGDSPKHSEGISRETGSNETLWPE